MHLKQERSFECEKKKYKKNRPNDVSFFFLNLKMLPIP